MKKTLKAGIVTGSKKSSKSSQARSQRDLLRRYFGTRVPQSSGAACWEVF